MNSELRQKAIRLRIDDNLSYSKIREKLNVPKSTLSYWLHEFPLSEEKIKELRRKNWSKGEASRERFRASMRKKRELKNKVIYKEQLEKMSNLSRDSLFIAGLMLYLGEGDKKNRYRLALANTDPDIIKFFIKWMIEFLGVDRNKVKVQLHLYENMDIGKERKFWAKQLNFPKEQFYKTQIRKLKNSSFSYSGSHRHGTCSIFLLGAEKKREVMMAIKAFMDLHIK